MDSILHLRDEDEEEEEEDNESALVVRTKRAADALSSAGSIMFYEAAPQTEDIPEKDPGSSSSGSPRSRQAPLWKDLFYDLFTGIEDVASSGEESDLFHGLRQALNQAAAVHREQCSHSQNELHRYAANLHHATDERNSLRLSLGQREEDIKDLRDELAKAYRDQNDLSEQLQQKIEMIGKLREEVDVIRMESLRWKEGMDHFAAKKETARAQLSSSETQLQKMKEKGLVHARRIEELEARLASVLAKDESDAEKAKADADALVAVYWADAEAAQVQARKAAESANSRAHWVTELAKCRSRRETLE
ncbi:MAR-binding filament-like protein 1-1 [Nicotiana tomentosiformis]|uniref:MAR-binding filament-like protein 1-1 n=1 Tax=Nicotiana tomentosiformis TaxID=4098 RepID=UPI00388C8A5A